MAMTPNDLYSWRYIFNEDSQRFFIKLKINSNSVWFPVFYDDSPVIILRILILTSALKPRERCKNPGRNIGNSMN